MPKIVDHDLRRVELARAVWAVVERDGVTAASIRAVAAEAGWTYGMIGYYFKRRDDLMIFAYRLAAEQARSLIPSEADQPDPLERLIGVVKRTLPVDETAALHVRIWLGFMARIADDPSLAQSVRREHDIYHSDVRQLVEECIEVGYLPRESDVETVTELIIVFADGLFLSAILDPEEFSPERIERKLRYFLSTLGLVPAKSR